MTVTAGWRMAAATAFAFAAAALPAFAQSPADFYKGRTVSVVVGSSLANVTADLLNSAGSIRLFTNGARRAIWRPVLQAGEANAVKSPDSIAAVGTKVVLSVGSWRIVVPWYPPKKNNLSLIRGPPIVPPN